MIEDMAYLRCQDTPTSPYRTCTVSEAVNLTNQTYEPAMKTGLLFNQWFKWSYKGNGKIKIR